MLSKRYKILRSNRKIKQKRKVKIKINKIMSQAHHLQVHRIAKNNIVKRKRKLWPARKTCKVKSKTIWPTKESN